jgi:hypothetical protein
MGAKKLKQWKPEAEPVKDDWRHRDENLSIFQLMTISKRSYGFILDMIKRKVLRPVDSSKPYRFTPNETARVFLPDQPRQDDNLVQEIRKDGRHRVVKRSKGDLRF